MNAVNPVQSPGVPSAAEPSMEEILASIRRIIADDTSLRPADAAEQAPGHALRHDEIAALPGPQAPQDAVLEPSPHVPHASEPERFAPEPPRHEADAPASTDAMPEAAPVPADALPGGHANFASPQFSSPEGTMAEPIARHPLAPPEVAGHGSVDLEPELAAPIPHDDEVAHPGAAPRLDLPHSEPLFSAVTDSSVTSAFNMLAASRFVDNSEQLSGLVREMIRPLVKAWVDEHLPGMVERLVVAEIERMGRR